MKVIDRTVDWLADHYDNAKLALSRDDGASIAAGVSIGVAVSAVALMLMWPAHRQAVLPGAIHASVQSGVHQATQTAQDVYWRLAPARTADFAGLDVTHDARRVAQWVAASRDNRAMTFAILDKRAAQLFVFDADARLIGESRVLLGAAPGDDSVPGIGQRPMDQVRPDEKTTPAGRFISHPGRNSGGEEVIWVDYGAAVSMHRVRLVDPKERRFERLAHGGASDRRISYGCINIPVSFFDVVMKPHLGSAPGVVYVLPEQKSLAEVFPALTDVASPSAQQARANL